MLILNDINGAVFRESSAPMGAKVSIMTALNFEQLLNVDSFNQQVLTIEDNELRILFDSQEGNWGFETPFPPKKFDFIQLEEDPKQELIVYI